ncbi:hypothetical protein E0H86_11720 [Acinetobacter sp. ANC 4635]|uniref:hypothetical protein n=1 Tax=Acinetobacter sp. ANC 4635 TaxID=2529846 RepID=UPI00103C2D28|nr:hypothetical protein [Acinetobacter sp. ANC 4635]TCB28468.1 hypothetical protein E0H86_11720 [Acinetobacter sp. ANC 4635]
MRKAFDFNDEFGILKELCCKNFNKIQISIHPDFSGIYICYREAFKSLKSDLSILTSAPKLYVWKDPNISGYAVAHSSHWYLYFSKSMPNNIKLSIQLFPQEKEKIEQLKKVASSEFIKFLSSYHHDLDRMNPEKLLRLINTHISSEVILTLNKENSYKPHTKMSLELLAKLLSQTRNQLNYRNKAIAKERQYVLDELEKNSEIVQQLLNNPNFILSPDQLWKM